MKKLIISDTHLGLYNDSDIWLDIVTGFFKNITKYCIKNNINQIIHLGDFFDNRKSLNTKTQHAAHRIANILSLHKSLDVKIIVGNHDCYYKNQIQPNTLELFEKYDNIEIIDEIKEVDDILLVPWGKIPNKEYKGRYCFGHFAINGFHMNDSAKCYKGLDSLKFKDFELVLSGHFHTPSSGDNIIYVGAPYGQTFHDVNGIRGFHIFEDGKLDFIQYEDAPIFMRISSESDLSENIEGNIIKIVFEKDYGTNKNQEIIDLLLNKNPLLYSIDFAHIKNEEEDYEVDESIEMESKEKIVDLFIDKNTFASNINVFTLKQMFKKIMKEASNGKSETRSSNGLKIETDSIGFQNFLSFGSKWQDVKLENGINFVTGMDEDRNKSNAAGKSSFLETIPFALFGKTAREINQNQIINWKNKNNCLVVFRFKMNGELYEVKRGLKPNIFEIYKNGEPIKSEAHKKDYQSMFEEMFGMDSKMFMNIIHSNVNNSSGILSMKKPEKRAFLEKMFGLEIFSDMNKLSNDKLRNLEQKKYKESTDISSIEEKIKYSNEMKNKFSMEINGKKEVIDGIIDIKEKLDIIIEDNPNIDKDIEDVINEKKEKIKLLNEEEIKLIKNKTSLEIELENIRGKIKTIEKEEEQRRLNEKLENEKENIISKIGDLDSIKSKIERKESNIEANYKDLEVYNKIAVDLQKELTAVETNLKNAKNNINLLSKGICPTCGQDVTDNKNNFQKEADSYEKEIKIINDKIKNNKKDLLKVEDDNNECKKNLSLLRRSLDRLMNIESQIKNVGTQEEKDELEKNQKSIVKKIGDIEKVYSKNCEKINFSLKALENKERTLKEIKSNILTQQRKYDIEISKVEEIKKNIESLKSMINEQNEIIKKSEIKKEEINSSIIKMNNLIDYLNAIKFILKDENIKQFTIKQIMPFLNKQTNYYLSEINYGFYILIDKWLDVEIKGPGIRNASYDSLSGGERRGIDIAMQLALLDIARIQAGIFPDLLIFDELLDSSIDGSGINELMKIVRKKQNDNGDKIFIISHRSEFDQELIDNHYHVTKKNGYSTVLKKG